MLSKKTKYALLALQVLAQHHGEAPMLISDIAQKGRIPKKFLEQILLGLKSTGYVKSRRGLGGGYSLQKDPKNLFLGPVVRQFSGALALVPCVSKTEYAPCDECENVASCGLKVIFAEIRDHTAHILDTKTIADVTAEADCQKKNPTMYHI